jgi:hypothetical protein
MVPLPPPQGPVAWPHPFASPEWHPTVQALFGYWRDIAPPGGGLPGRQHVDPMAIPALLPDLWLLDVHRNPLRLRYRVVGTRMVDAIGRETTGEWLDEAHPDVAGNAAYFERYRQVCDTRLPSWRRGVPRLALRTDFNTLESLFLPLARDGATVDMILAMTVFHATPAQAAPLAGGTEPAEGVLTQPWPATGYAEERPVGGASAASSARPNSPS